MEERNYYDTLPDERKKQIAHYLGKTELEELRQTCRSRKQLMDAVVKTELFNQIERLLDEEDEELDEDERGLLRWLLDEEEEEREREGEEMRKRTDNIVESSIEYKIGAKKRGKPRCIIL